MRRFTINKHYATLRKKRSDMGRKSQAVQENARLASALAYGPRRPIESYLVFQIRTRNPRTGQEHEIEIKSDPGAGNNRYHVYLDGVKWAKPWSRWGFCRWLFDKIDRVLTDWD
jgi:hypothetical protein